MYPTERDPQKLFAKMPRMANAGKPEENPKKFRLRLVFSRGLVYV